MCELEYELELRWNDTVSRNYYVVHKGAIAKHHNLRTLKFLQAFKCLTLYDLSQLNLNHLNLAIYRRRTYLRRLNFNYYVKLKLPFFSLMYHNSVSAFTSTNRYNYTD